MESDWQNAAWPIELDQPPQVSLLNPGLFQPSVHRYQLPGVWCIHFFRYRAALWIDGLRLPIRPNFVSVTPPGALLEYRFDEVDSRHVCAHFALPTTDRQRGGPGRLIRAMRDLGDAFEGYWRKMHEAATWHASEPRRAEARLWDLLWQLSEPAGDAEGADMRHPALAEACRLIELHLTEPLRVAELAERASVSHNHLTRLFREAFGRTVVDYIRLRRVQRARHLLVKTRMPIKVVAAEVGVADLQRFNKLVRRELGMSPRQVRQRRPSVRYKR